MSMKRAFYLHVGLAGFQVCVAIFGTAISTNGVAGTHRLRSHGRGMRAMIDSSSGMQTLMVSSAAERVIWCSMDVNVIDARLPVKRFRQRCNMSGTILRGYADDQA
jgi:hypothetical protein